MLSDKLAMGAVLLLYFCVLAIVFLRHGNIRWGVHLVVVALGMAWLVAVPLPPLDVEAI